MNYRIRLMTPTSNWASCPSLILARDWTLKDFRKNENRLALIGEAMERLGLTDEDVTVFRLDPIVAE